MNTSQSQKLPLPCITSSVITVPLPGSGSVTSSWPRPLSSSGSRPVLSSGSWSWSRPPSRCRSVLFPGSVSVSFSGSIFLSGSGSVRIPGSGPIFFLGPGSVLLFGSWSWSLEQQISPVTALFFLSFHVLKWFGTIWMQEWFGQHREHQSSTKPSCHF